MLPNRDMSLTNEHTTIKYRNINDSTIKHFFNTITSSEAISNIYNHTNAKTAFSEFLEIFDHAYNNSFPIKTLKLTRKGYFKPWITRELIRRIKIRDNLAKLYKKQRIDKKTFTDFRNLLNKQIRQAKETYYNNKFEENKGNIKRTWETINNTIKTNSKISHDIVINVENNEIHKNEVPNEFINYFTNIADKLISELPPSNTNATSYLRDRVHNSFSMSQLVKKEIESAITGLKNNGKGVNKISTLVLKECKSLLSDILVFIC